MKNIWIEKKKNITIMLFFLITMMVVSGFTSMAVRAEGETGDTWNPATGSYVISTVADLNAFRASMITDKIDYTGKKIMLNNDITIDETHPLTSLKRPSSTRNFSGVFDGQGHSIIGYNDNQMAVFHTIAASGKVYNFNLESVDLQAFKSTSTSQKLGTLAMKNQGKIINCSATGTIKTATGNASQVGGLVGQNNGSNAQIINCYSRVNIEETNGKWIGGIAAMNSNSAIMQNCYATGHLTSTETETIYSIAYETDQTNIKGCYYQDTINTNLATINNFGAPLTETQFKDSMNSASNFPNWNFEKEWKMDATNGGYPSLRYQLPEGNSSEIQVKAVVKIKDKVVPDTDINTDATDFLKADIESITLVATDGKAESQTIIDDYHAKLELKDPDKGIQNPLTFTGVAAAKNNFDGKLQGFLSQYKLVYDDSGSNAYTLKFFSNEYKTGVLGEDFSVNEPAFTFNSKTTYSDDQKAAAIAATETRIQESLAYYLPVDVSGHDAVFGAGNNQYGSWLIFTSARAGYTPHAGFFDECYQAFEEKYTASKKVDGEGKPLNEGFDANEVAKDALAITAMGYDARNVAGYNLIEMLTNGKNPSDGYFVGQVSSFAIDSYNYLPGTQEAYAVELAKKALDGASTGNDPLIDMYIMGSQPLAAYYDPNAQEGTDLYYVKQAMETVFIPYFSRIQGYTGVFYSGISYNNPWSNAQVYIMLGMADVDIFQADFIKNGFSMLDSLASVSQSYSADQGQIARGYEAVVRAYRNENQLFDCTDVLNSTVPVNNAITALPEADAITDENKAAAQTALNAVDSLLTSLTLSDTQKNSIDKKKYNDVKAKLAGSDTDMAKAKAVVDQITAMSDTDKLTLADKEKVTKARADYKALTEAQKKLVANLGVLEAAEAKIAKLEATTGSEADKAEAKKVSDLIDGIKTVDQLKAGDKAEVMKSRKAFRALTDTQKKLVSEEAQQKLINAEAKIAELLKTVPPVKYEETGIEVTGLPAKVKNLIVKDKKDSAEVKAAAEKAATEAGFKNVTVVTLYDIKPDNMTDDELKTFNGDDNSYVTMILTIPENQRGASRYQIYHLKSDGKVEWITPVVSEDNDILIFTVSSFSDFGIIAEAETAGETENEKKAKTVDELIGKLPEESALALTDKTLVEQAQTAFEKLTVEQQNLVKEDNRIKLKAAVDKIAKLVNEANEADQVEAQKVINKIEGLPATNKLVSSNKQQVEEAWNAYTALNDLQKKLVKNIETLIAAKDRIAELEKTKADQAAAKKVTDQINALGTITKWEQKASIESARTEYNKLTSDQKALVSSDTLKILTNAETAIEKLKPNNGSITIDVERFTIGQGFYVEPVIVSIEEGETARQALEKLLGADNLVGDVGYLRAVKGADNGTATIPDYIVSKIGGDNSAVANAYSSRYGGDILGEFDYSKYSGWYYLVNNSAPNVGMDAYTLNDGDVMRLAFTYWGTGSDITGIEYGTNKVLVNIANKDSLLKAIAAVNANKSTYLSDAGIKTAYDTAMTVVQDMTATFKATNDAAIALNKAVANSAKTDQEIAKKVSDQIDALPVVTKLALTDKDAVTAARIGYDALTATQKAFVTNFSTLAAAEAKIAELEKEATEVANKAAAKAVTDKIAALPSGTALLLGEKADVVAARIAYNALTETQKALVTNLSALILAETRIAELEAETPVVKDIKTGIEAIGLPAGTAIKVGDESADTDKTGEALKSAKKQGIKDAKIISLYAIKPDMSDTELEKFNNDATSYVTLTIPLSTEQWGYDSYQIYHKKINDGVEWITPTLSEDGKSLIFKVNAFSDFGVVGTKTTTDTEIPVVDFSYCTHVQNVGWQNWRNNGDMSGTQGKSLRLEGIQIKRTDTADVDLGIRYETHIENIGWEDDWKADGDTSGTEGRSLRLEAIRIELTGADAKNYDVYYQVHAQNIGWMAFAQNGKEAGTAGFGYRLEGIRVVVVPKGQAAPTPEDGSIETAFLIRR
ncbi:DUF4430 domain-containing protein [Acetobacterium carbinolicum]|uniref:DUF4430 domain-containing protein n=1 Tax=Acetobacterium carbinolicum TaxID=52690 RepID=UPI0039C9E90B